MFHIAYFQSNKGLNLWIISLIKWGLGIDILSSFLVHPTAARDRRYVPPRDFSDHMEHSSGKTKTIGIYSVQNKYQLTAVRQSMG